MEHVAKPSLLQLQRVHSVLLQGSPPLCSPGSYGFWHIQHLASASRLALSYHLLPEMPQQDYVQLSHPSRLHGCLVGILHSQTTRAAIFWCMLPHFEASACVGLHHYEPHNVPDSTLL